MEAASVIYDLCCPSPLPLKETASIAVALEIWRTEIREHRKNNTLGQMFLITKDLSSIYQLKNAPSCVIHNMKIYLKEIGSSISKWLGAHRAVFNQNSLLLWFDDFVCDFDGTIDSDKTARRVIYCDRVSLKAKFKLACVHCFEDEILRMWPEVSLITQVEYENELNLDNPQLFYWVCRLRNQLYKFNYVDCRDFSMKDVFCKFIAKLASWSLVKYFLHCLDLQTRLSLIESQNCCLKIVCRHLMVVFSDEEIQKLVDTKGDQIIFGLVSKGERFALPVWAQVKSKMSGDVFKRMVQTIFTRCYGDYYNSGRENHSLVGIWKTAPDFLKNAVVSDVLTANSLTLIRLDDDNERTRLVYLPLLEAMLSDTPTEGRKTFWNNQCTTFITKVGAQDVDYFMKLCLSDDCERDEFKKKVLSTQYQELLSRCFNLVGHYKPNFQELQSFSKYWAFDEETMKRIRSKILLEGVHRKQIPQVRSVIAFIDYSYKDDTNMANKFKAQLLLIRSTWKQLREYLYDRTMNQNYSMWLVINFVDTLAPSQEIANKMKKKRIVPFIEDYVGQNAFSLQFSYHLPFLMKWAFETDEELAEFKKTLDADRIIQGMIRREMRDKMSHLPGRVDNCSALRCHIRMPHTSNYLLEDFLRWLMGNGEAVEELKKKYEDDEVFVRLMKASKKI